MRTLSTRRRHPLAGPVVLLLGLLAAAATYAIVQSTWLSPAEADTESSTARDIQAGQDLFLVGCASCHGKNAQGIDTKQGANFGPPLIGVGAAAVDFQVGTGRMPMAQAGQQAARKAPVYDEEEIRQLSAYIASLGPGPAIPEERWLQYEDATEEDITEGGEFFRTNCTACHNSVGAGGALPSGRYAPALDGVSAKHIYEAMTTGPQQMPVFNDDIISPEDKRNVIAYIKAVQDEPAYGGVGGRVGPVVDGIYAWIVGIGGLILFAIWIGAHGARTKKQKS